MPPPRIYYVAERGDDEADGRTLDTAWRTLRKASQEVAPGDMVRIGPGLYRHPIAPLRGGLPGRRITFEATGEGVARIYGFGVVAPLVRLAGKSHVTVRGLTFDIGRGKVPPGYLAPHLSPGGVFQVSNCEDIEILNCRAGSDRSMGGGLGSNMVNAGNVRGLRVEGNVSWGARYHLWLSNCADVLIRNNTFVETRIISCILDNRAQNVRILNNIWYRPCGPKKNNEVLLFRGDAIRDVVSDYNLFYSPYKQHTTVGRIQNAKRETVILGENLAAWQQKTPYDRHSRRADPLFVNVKEGDFRLKPESPARGAGEEGVDLGATGWSGR